MTANNAIQGTEVLKAIAYYLADRGVRPYICLVPCGNGNTPEKKKQLC